MPRPIILGVVGDSAAGKTTHHRGLVRVLGEDDGDARLHRRLPPLRPQAARRAEHHAAASRLQLPRHHGAAPAPSAQRRADPEAGLPARRRHLRRRPSTSSPSSFAVVEGLLGYHTQAMRDCYDVRVFLAPPEELRRKWKVQRDCSRRGYTTDQVLAELDRREPDSAAFIRPQERYADIVVSFLPGDERRPRAPRRRADPARRPPASRPLAVHRQRRARHHDERARRRAPRAHPRRHRAPSARRRSRRRSGSGCTSPATCAAERLGEFTIGTDLHRSESLALVQLLILYHLVTGRAAVALGRQELERVAS